MDVNDQTVEILDEYPIEIPVPAEARHYGFWDMIATWVGANANTSSWYTGGVIAGAGAIAGLMVIFIANPIAYAVMALIGYMGYKVGTTSMGLTRASFGIRGSILPSVLNAIQFIGWCASNTFIAALSMGQLLYIAFGWDPSNTWVTVLSVIFISLLQIFMTVVQGTRSIKIAERVAVVALIFLTIWQTIILFKTFSISQILAWQPGAEYKIRFGEAMDVMVAFSFGWIPAIAEFTRYAKNRKTAVVAPMIGANVALFWFAIVGMFGAIGNSISMGTFDPNTSDPSTVIANLGLGWVAFAVLILATVTTNCVNIYSAGMSVANVVPKFGEKKSIYAASIATVLVSLIPIFVSNFYDLFVGFLSYVGLIFAPLLAIMIVDFYFIRERNYDWSQSAKIGGIYWYKNGINWVAVGSWLAGVAIYFLFMRVNFIMNSLGAIYSTVIVTGILYYVASKVINKNEIDHSLAA